MSQLIQLRQRLKAIETIKKITSAMRIISRSLHTRMNKQKKELESYQEHVKTLFENLYRHQQNWSSSFFFPVKQKISKKLYIIVGAQKGLCGSYNTELIYWLGKNHDMLAHRNIDIAVIGNRTFENVNQQNLKIIKQFDELKSTTIKPTTESLIDLMKQARPFYQTISIVCSVPQTFFVNRLQEKQLIPFNHEELEFKEADDYLWQHDPEILLQKTADLYLQSMIYNTLFLSLLGEQSARFIAMDNATRNADNFIDSMQLQYNKMRQAKITRELTELSANFQNR